MSFNAGGGSSSVSASTDVALSNVADSHALIYDGGIAKWRNAGLTKSAVGLGSVDNTSDATKNSATATLTNKTISGATNTLTNIPQTAVTNLTTDLAGKAATTHAHTATDITDFTEATQDVLNSTLVAGTNVTLSYDDPANTLTISATPGAGVTDLSVSTTASDVTIISSTGNDATVTSATGSNAGILTATDKTKLDGIATGATANSSDATLLNRANHTGSQAISTVTGLQTALDGKATSAHSHGQADITNLAADLAAKQPLDSNLTAISAIAPSDNDVLQRKSGAWTNRTPAQLKADLTLAKSDVGLGNVDNTSDAAKNSATATLTNKTISGASNTITNIAQSSVTNLTTDLAGKAAASHTHVRADVTDIGLKVVAQSTAPADTSVIWVKTS